MVACRVHGEGLEPRTTGQDQQGVEFNWKVRDEPPEIIRQKVKETYATWDEFCAAIKEVDTSHIRDGMKKHQKEKEEKERVESMIASLCQQQQHRQPAAPPSPMSNTSNALQSLTIRNMRTAPATAANAAPQATTTNTNPFRSSGGGQGNLNFPANCHCPSPTWTAMHFAKASHSIPYSPTLWKATERGSSKFGIGRGNTEKMPPSRQ